MFSFRSEQTTKEALLQITKTQQENLFTTVVFSENWHKGIIGIVASRLIETHYKPTLVFTEGNEKMVASARSVKNFDIHKALEECSHLDLNKPPKKLFCKSQKPNKKTSLQQ